MKVRVKMEDFIADEEDKELARVAFHRAEKDWEKLLWKVGFLTFFLLLPVALLGGWILAKGTGASIAAFLSVFVIYSVGFFSRDKNLRRFYYKQLDELKLQMRKK